MRLLVRGPWWLLTRKNLLLQTKLFTAWKLNCCNSKNSVIWTGPTNRVYTNSWQVFQSWYSNHSLEPLTAKVGKVLTILQEVLEKDLSSSTLRRQVMTLSAVKGTKKGKSQSQYSHVKSFLRGISFISPPQVYSCLESGHSSPDPL